MKKNNFTKYIFKILFSILLVFAWKLFKNRHTFLSNFKTFCKEEGGEVKELTHHEESVKEFYRDSIAIFKDFFIPHEGNNHKPKILRPRSLIAITLVLAILKISVVGYLFFIYPYQAKMSVEVVNRVLELTNKDRQENNLGSLTINPVLIASAQAKAQDLIDKNYFAHHSPDGKKPWDFINRDEYQYLYVGENLAMNFTTADSVHAALMNSPTHKKNILNDKYNEVGIAMLSGEIDGRKTNVLVELFASRKTETKLASQGEVTTPKVDQSEVEKSIQDRVEPKKEEIVPEKIAVLDQGVVNSVTSNPTIIEKDVNPIEIQGIGGVTGIPQIEQELILENQEAVVMSDVSPNVELEQDKEVVIRKVENIGDNRVMVVAKISKYAQNIFIGALIFMTLALFVNIVVRIEVQHKGAILQTMLVIVFITSLIYFKFNYLESGIVNIFIV